MHHVHPNTAPGDLGDRLGRRKARRQYELGNFVIAKVGVCGHQPAFHRLFTHRFYVDAGAIITDLDDHIAAFTRQPQIDATNLRLAIATTYFGRFDAMVDGVAQHMLQRRNHPFQKVAI